MPGDHGSTVDTSGDRTLLLQLDKVDFCYPQRHGQKSRVFALRNISLNLYDGEIVCLAGTSGSGKTTLASIIVGMYEPTCGNLMFNVSRKRIAWVGQKPVLFEGTLADNISYGSPSANLRDIEVAAQAAGCGEFIKKSPRGLDTTVGCEGSGFVHLSGGEKARLSVARALLVKPVIMVMDEPTAGLDAASSRSLMQSLRCYVSGTSCSFSSHRTCRAVVIVSHDPIVQQLSDRIVWMSNGILQSQ